jgi:hypothetical protein
LTGVKAKNWNNFGGGAAGTVQGFVVV